MTEQLISFETAKLAKEKGFGLNSYTGFVFDEDKTELNLAFYDMENKYARPTQSLLQKWLREQYGIFLTIGGGVFDGEIRYQPVTYTKDTVGTVKVQKPYYDTYEEALELGLQAALKLINL